MLIRALRVTYGTSPDTNGGLRTPLAAGLRADIIQGLGLNDPDDGCRSRSLNRQSESAGDGEDKWWDGPGSVQRRDSATECLDLFVDLAVLTLRRALLPRSHRREPQIRLEIPQRRMEVLEV